MRPRLTRVMRALGITSTGTVSSNESEGKSADTSSEDNGPPREVFSAITSDLGVPTTFDEAFFGAKSDVWIPTIYEERMSFISRGAFKKRDKKQLRRKLMTKKWIFKERLIWMALSSTRQDAFLRGFMQIPGVDYTESFAPVSSDSGIRIVIGICLYYFHNFQGMNGC
jgi:hypothetical protein